MSNCTNHFLDCLLYAVGKPVYHRYTDQIYGCWMRDSDPRTSRDGEKYWVTSEKPEDSHKLFEFENKSMFRKNTPSKYAINLTKYIATYQCYFVVELTVWIMHFKATLMLFITDRFSTIRREPVRL